MECHRSIGILLYFIFILSSPSKIPYEQFPKPTCQMHSRENAEGLSPQFAQDGQSSVKDIKPARLVASHCLSCQFSDFMHCSLCEGSRGPHHIHLTSGVTGQLPLVMGACGRLPHRHRLSSISCLFL